MKNFFLALICLVLVGCATVPGVPRPDQKIAELESIISKKDEEIKLKESQLKEKDAEISRLRKKLESFGVF